MRMSGLLLLTVLMVARPAHAQQREGLSLFVLGGGVRTFQKLNDAGTAFLGGGPFLGAGVDWAPENVPGLAVLGELAWTRHGLGGSQPTTGTQVDLILAGVDLGWIYVNTEKVSATFFGGGGGLFLHEGASGTTRLEPFSRLGLDAHYQISSRVGLLVQLTGMMYTISGFPSTSALAGYDHRQGDAWFGAGVTVRF